MLSKTITPEPRAVTMPPALRSSQARQSSDITTGCSVDAEATEVKADYHANLKPHSIAHDLQSNHSDLVTESEDSLSTSSMTSHLSYADFRSLLTDVGSRLANIVTEPPSNLAEVQASLQQSVSVPVLDPKQWAEDMNEIRGQNEDYISRFLTQTILPVELWRRDPELCLGTHRAWIHPTSDAEWAMPDLYLCLPERWIRNNCPRLVARKDLLTSLQIYGEQYLPVLTVEEKGSTGKEYQGVLQNESSSIRMIKLRETLNRMLCRRKRFDDGKILALSIVLTNNSLSVWGHWKMTEKKLGADVVHTLHAELAATRYIDGTGTMQLGYNAFATAKNLLLKKIMRDLQQVESKLQDQEPKPRRR